MVSDSEADLAAKLKEKGMEINEVDKAVFAQAVQSVWKDFEPVFGPDLMATLQKYREVN
jgi:TRAP-type C4-dicarboxylate transport system substrate-binding protein